MTGSSGCFLYANAGQCVDMKVAHKKKGYSRVQTQTRIRVSRATSPRGLSTRSWRERSINPCLTIKPFSIIRCSPKASQFFFFRQKVFTFGYLSLSDLGLWVFRDLERRNEKLFRPSSFCPRLLQHTICALTFHY